MDEYLSEKEQIEQIRQWWSDYGWYILGGAAIALLGFFGFRYWEGQQNAAAEAASALYRELEAAVEDDDLAGAQSVLSRLQADFAGSPYASNGALMIASTVLVSNADRAIELLRGVMQSADDAELAMIARLRLARVLSWREQHDAALQLLAVEDSGPFAARISDIRGDVLYATGDTDGARAAWTAALILPGSDAVDRNFLQMKLNSLMTVETAAAADMPAADASEADAAEADAIDLEAIEAGDTGGAP